MSEKIAWTFLVIIFALIKVKKNEGLKKIFLILNLNLFTFVLTTLMVDYTFSKFPQLIPKGIINFAPYLSPELKRTQSEVLEYLNESPW